MKNTLNIFSNDTIKHFIDTLLNEYKLVFMKLDSIEESKQTSQANIILINNNKDANLVNFDNLDNNSLIITSLKNLHFDKSKNFELLSTPVSINHIKKTIENFLQNLKLRFHDLLIDNEKLKNLSNNSFCYLTKVELEILSCLIKEKETSKKFIKENILNIKSNIETNSLESHLTRIRKKMLKVKTSVKIQAKSERLTIKF